MYISLAGPKNLICNTAAAGEYVVVSNSKEKASMEAVMSSQHITNMSIIVTDVTAFSASLSSQSKWLESKQTDWSSEAIVESQALASISALINAPVSHDSAKDPFTFTFAKASGRKSGTPGPSQTTASAHVPTPAPAPTTSVPPPPGTPIGTVPPGSRSSGAPPGVPFYNWRMCQNDLIGMRQNNQKIHFDQSGTQSESH